MELFPLIVLEIVFCLAGLVGGVLFIIGVFGKKRSLTRAAAFIVFLSSFVITISFFFASAKIVRRLKSAPRKMWEAVVNVAFDDTKVPLLNPKMAKQILAGNLGEPAGLNIVNIQGCWISGVMLDYGYFLYNADEKQILTAVSKAPVDPLFDLPSDNACKAISWTECKKALLYEKGPERTLPGWTPEGVIDKHCYQCLRCPYMHTILIDGNTGTVYHSISEIRK